VEPSEPSEEDKKQWEHERCNLEKESRLVVACLLYGASFPFYCFYLVKLGFLVGAYAEDVTGVAWIVYWLAQWVVIIGGVAIPWISWSRFVKPHRRGFFDK
jgi:hypothetical protein